MQLTEPLWREAGNTAGHRDGQEHRPRAALWKVLHLAKGALGLFREAEIRSRELGQSRAS